MKGYMEKPEMTTRQVNFFNIWYETKDPSFVEISKQSKIPKRWLNYSVILQGKNKDSIIKPINRYVERLVPPPSLVSIENGIVRLRQGNHAEFFLLEHEDGSFYNIDRPWIRQYYNTDESLYSVPPNCFDGTFKFYIPWFIDSNVDVSIEQSEDSPFTIYPSVVKFTKILENIEAIEPYFVPFHFKREGSHMVTDNFGKIPRQSAMFDMVFPATDIMIKEIKDFYEKKETADN